MLLAWGFFCAALVPVLGFTDVGFMQYSLVADHYPYIALIGVVALVAAGFSYWRGRTHGVLRWATTAIPVGIVATFMVLSWNQSRLFANPFALYQATLAKNPSCWVVQNNLGNILFTAGQPEEAVRHYKQALHSKPDYAEAHINLAPPCSNRDSRWMRSHTTSKLCGPTRIR